MKILKCKILLKVAFGNEFERTKRNESNERKELGRKKETKMQVNK